MRRAFALVLILAAAGIVALVFGRRAADPGPQGRTTLDKGKRPLVLITIDTTRADRLEPYGATDVATPALQRLADRGVTFENAYAVAPITLVSHTSIMTGTYPFEHGVRNNGIQYVPDEMTTLAEILKERGYRTGAFVSAAVLEKRYGLDQGFEVYDDDLSAGRDRRPRSVPDRPAEATIASITQWLDGLESDENFFLWAHFYDPHANYSPPPPFRDQYRERLYDGEIAYLDDQLGKLFRHPRMRGAGSEEPIVTVIADHGESLGEHGEQTHAILAYDSTLHVPWLLYVPGGPQGLRIQQNVGHVDVTPTLLSLLGLDAPEDSKGRDLVPIIEGRVTPGDGNTAYYGETYLPFYTYGWAKLRTLRRGGWKFIDAPTPELYDIAKDPRELSNVHGGQPGMAHDLERDLDELLEAAGGADRETTLAIDKESAEKLRSLGYLAAGSAPARSEADRPDPKDVVDLHVGMERARTMLQDRLFEQASQQLRRVLERDPENLAALVDLSSALEGMGDLDAAHSAIERALRLDPDYDRLYLLMARLEARLDQPEKALELVDLAISKDPRNPDALIQKSVLLARTGRADEAVTVLAAGLEAAPDHPRMNLQYARVAEMANGNLAAAEERIRAALDRDPFLAGGWLTLGQILNRQSRFDEAEVSFKEGLARRVDDQALHASLGQLLARRHKRKEAESHLREALRLSERMRPDLHIALGALLAEGNRLEEAQQQYAMVLESDPEHPGARNNKAIALYRSGRFGEAVQLLEALVEDFPRMADAHNNLAAVAIERQQWRKVELHSRRTLELDSQMVQAWNNLAVALEEQGRTAEAFEAYEQAVATDPDYWQARFNHGILLSNHGQPEKAEALFIQVLNEVPSLAEGHYQLAELYAGPLEDPEKARTHFNAFLRYAANDPRAASVRQRIGELPRGS
ncbi:MAG: tetratricopeptide repeat protein [Acidobacteriota bacterium]